MLLKMFYQKFKWQHLIKLIRLRNTIMVPYYCFYLKFSLKSLQKYLKTTFQLIHGFPILDKILILKCQFNLYVDQLICEYIQNCYIPSSVNPIKKFKRHLTYTRVSNFRQNVDSKISLRLIRGSTYTRVYTKLLYQAQWIRSPVRWLLFLQSLDHCSGRRVSHPKCQSRKLFGDLHKKNWIFNGKL
jgi:hypothetical protein